LIDDLTPFINYIKRIVTLSAEELSEFIGVFTLKKVKKKQFIIQPDFTARHRSYVLQGAFRSYVLDQEGIDHTIQFALEDWWIGDINSYIYQKPATMFVVALEDSSILQISYDAEQQLKASNHSFEKFFRIVSERTAAFHQRRIISSLTRTAEQRYDDFMEAYPTVSQRLPQYALASYLGMTTEFLSKIRNNKLKKKI
jgi:CRP-like cAMP-binding protein